METVRTTADRGLARHGLNGVRHLAAAASERGIPDALAGLGVVVDDLDDSHHDVSAREHVAAVRGVLSHGIDPTELGIDVGRRVNLAQLGLFGFTALASGSLRELLDVSLRYYTLTSMVMGVTVSEDDTECVVSLHSDHLPADVAPYFAARDLAGIAAVAPTFLTSTFSAFQDDVCLDLVEGDELIFALAEVLPVGRVSLGPEPRKVRFPRGLMDEPLPQADRATQEACLAQCEELLRSRAARLGPAARVRTLLLSDTVAPPTFEAVAASLLTHPRTLRRQLVAEGTSYRDLLNEVRSELAMELISEVGLSVEQTSRRLGYADMASFTHAFTRWYGEPPSRFRGRHWHRSVNSG